MTIRVCRAASLLLPLLGTVSGGTPLAAQTATRNLAAPAPPAAPGVVIRRVTEPPRLESFLTGSALADNTAITDFRQREPGDGVPASQGTAAYVSYDDANLYIVFVCRDDPAKVRANVARREDISHDDHVVVYLDTFRDRKRAYRFAVNPLGVQQDGILTEGQSEDLTFDAVWSAEGRLTDSGYVVRMSIPFRSLRFSNDSVQTWGIALGRAIPRENERSYWPHLTKRIKGFVPQFSALEGLAAISPGRNLQLNPYTVLARARVLDEDMPGHVTEADERIGGDAKLILRDALTLDGTVNPDFSQVETDDPQVTLNRRFAVFFPEKRPFFLENAGYYQTPVNLFFSRQIVDPGAGLRLSGKAGRWSVAALAINDRAASATDAWIGAVRVQRELGDESTVGLLVTDREFLRSWQSDRIFSVDGRWRAGDNWSLTGQLMRSENREYDGTRATGWGVLVDLGFDSRNVEYATKYVDLAPTFEAPLGFVSRVGFRRNEHDLQYTIRPRAGPFTSLGPTLTLNLFWDHATGQLIDREMEGQFEVELRGNTKLQVGRVEAFERFEGLPFRPHATQVGLSTEWLKWIGVEVTHAWGAAVNHDPATGLAPSLERARESEVGVTVRPTPRLRFEQAYNYADLRNAAGRLLVDEVQLRGKLNYQFSPLLSLRTIVDWKAGNTDTTLVKDDARQRRVGIDVLLTYLLHPGTALYLGYTDRYENLEILPGPPRELGPSRSPGLSVGRQVFVKASYLLRF